MSTGYKGIKPEQGFKKGVSGNPKGRPKVFGMNSGVEKMSSDHLARTISKYFAMSLEEMESFEVDPMTPSIELVIAASIRKGVRTGKLAAISGLIDRVIGKPKEMVEMDVSVSARQAIAEIPHEVITNYLRSKVAAPAILSESDKT